MYPELIDFFESRSVLILGFGREGRSTYDFIRRYLPEKKLTIADINPVLLSDENTEIISGEGYLDRLNDFDLVMKSPGISIKDAVIEKSTLISCQTDLFLRFSQCRTVGISGTKGKTTTSTLIYEILKAAGINTCLIGNIGVPVFEEIGNSHGMTAVIELSSHQLEFTRSSPNVAVLTNIYPEHLDHYKSYSHYVKAKLNIVRHQSSKDFFIYNKDQDISEFLNLSSVGSNKIPVSAYDGESDAFLKSIAEINPKLPGAHNRQDIFYAANAARCLGVGEESIKKGIENFSGIEHRMEKVGQFKGIKFYNDCIATIPAAVICAVEALGDVDSLIFGGMDRGLEYVDFAEYLNRCEISNLICLPDTGHNIGKFIMEMGSDKNIIFAQGMEEAVKKAYELTARGHSCILSPAASSYNMYRNFEDKGRHFKALVLSMAE